MNFSHLHVHTQFSLLDGAADIGALYKKAVADKMRGIAITDHGNMFGVFKFVGADSDPLQFCQPVQRLRAVPFEVQEVSYYVGFRNSGANCFISSVNFCRNASVVS